MEGAGHLANPTLRVRKYMHTRERLGQVVAEARAATGVSGSELADLAQVEPSVIESLESGRIRGNLGGVRRVLTALGIEPLALPFALLAEPE